MSVYDSVRAVSDGASSENPSSCHWFSVDAALSSATQLSQGNDLLGRRERRTATDRDKRPRHDRLPRYKLECWQLTCQFPTWQSPVCSSSHCHKWLITNHPLYESLMSLSSVRVHLQLMQTQNWLPWQHPLHPRSRLCLHWIACPRKPTPRIKQRVASCHTTEVIAHRKPKSGCHGNVP